MNIEIQGLTDKQQAFCDIIWNLGSLAELEKFLSMLPEADRLVCQSLVELIQLAFLDEVDSTDEAEEVLARFKLA